MMNKFLKIQCLLPSLLLVPVLQGSPVLFEGTPIVENFNSIFVPAPDSEEDPTVLTGTNTVGNQVAIPDLPGWQAARIGGSGSSNIAIWGDSPNAGGRFHAWGEDGDRSFGSLSSGANNQGFGLVIENDTGDTLNEVSITYTRRIWHAQGTSTSNPFESFMEFSYGVESDGIEETDFITSTAMTRFLDLDAVSPASNTVLEVSGGTDPDRRRDGFDSEWNEEVSGTITGIVWEPGELLFIRWNDFNQSGFNAGLAIDDFELTATFDPDVEPPEEEPEPITNSYTGGTWLETFDSLVAIDSDNRPALTGTGVVGNQVEIPNLNGWQAARLGGSSTADITLWEDSPGAGGRFYAWGDDVNRSLGSIASGASIQGFGTALVNETDETYDSVTITYTRRIWHLQGTGGDGLYENWLEFAYGFSGEDITAENFITHVDMIRVEDLDAVSDEENTVTGTSSGTDPDRRVNGFDAEWTEVVTATLTDINWEPGEMLFLRWNDFDQTGFDAGIAVDDLRVRADDSTGPQPIAYSGGFWTEDFDSIPVVDTDSRVSLTGTNVVGNHVALPGLEGWYGARLGGSGTGNITLWEDSPGAGGRFYAWGQGTNRSLGSLASGASVQGFGVALRNDSSETYREIVLSYTQRIWHRQGTSTDNLYRNWLEFGYGLSTDGVGINNFLVSESVTEYPEMDVVSSASNTVTGTNAGTDPDRRVNGMDPQWSQRRSTRISDIEWAPGETLFLRWNDFDQDGFDAGMAIDDLEMIALSVPGAAIFPADTFVQAIPYGGGAWYRDPSFGWLGLAEPMDLGNPWIYAFDHQAWWFVVQVDGDGFWLFDTVEEAWFFTSYDIAPWMYQLTDDSEGEWVYRGSDE
ncbi:MAG: hypothetical protein JJU20_08020 [Opitutales bacterium]|nr:hypothetical protein [Opitutales bacterium]